MQHDTYTYIAPSDAPHLLRAQLPNGPIRFADLFRFLFLLLLTLPVVLTLLGLSEVLCGVCRARRRRPLLGQRGGGGLHELAQ